MGAAAHRIGRVVFDIEVPDQAALAAFGDAVRARFDAVIEPALEAALDRIDRPGALIRLDRIEIDLGTLAAASDDVADLTRRIAESLAAVLSAPPEDTETAGARDDPAELAAFLESGELPWAEPGRALAALADALLALDGPRMQRLAARLRTVLIRRRSAERLVRQLPAALVRRLLRALLPEPFARPLMMFGPDAPASADAPVPDVLAARATDMLQALARGSPLPDLGEAVALFAALDSRIPAAAREAFAPPQAAPPAVKPVAEPVLPEAAEIETEAEPGAPGDEPEPAPATLRPVHAAGAVLLHPFLSTFFGRLGLLDGSRFRDLEAQTRAVLLAHHLATGGDDAPEPETVLFKLLCGMEIAEPVPRRIALTDAERAEADAVLEGAVTHWGKLGRTSPEGLREGFLSRRGTLQRRGGLWLLTVERRGIDILLDDLPWTFSRVKTPFMRQIMTVDWR